MAAQEFIITAIKKGSIWSGSYGEFQDYALALKGIGEPVKLSLPLPIIEDPTIGDHLYGRLYDEKARDGRVYHKLKIEKRPEEDRRQQSIEAQFSLRLAVEVYLAGDNDQAAYANIETEARHFLDILSNLKGN